LFTDFNYVETRKKGECGEYLYTEINMEFVPVLLEEKEFN
jgi:hypothetical protein